MNEEQETGGADTRQDRTWRLAIAGSDRVFLGGLVGAMAALWLLDGWGDLGGWALVVVALLLASLLVPVAQRWMGGGDEGGSRFSFKSKKKVVKKA